MKYREGVLLSEMKSPCVLPDDILRDFELSNLIRLGLVKTIQEPFANSQTLEIPNNSQVSHLTVDLDIDVESNINNILTELGELFLDACTEKSEKT
jgi:hypothetical protein